MHPAEWRKWPAIRCVGGPWYISMCDVIYLPGLHQCYNGTRVLTSQMPTFGPVPFIPYDCRLSLNLVRPLARRARNGRVMELVFGAAPHHPVYILPSITL